MHEFRRTEDGFYRTGYPLSPEAVEFVYTPYEAAYLRMERLLDVGPRPSG